MHVHFYVHRNFSSTVNVFQDPSGDPGSVDCSNSYILCRFAHNTYKLDRIKN